MGSIAKNNQQFLPVTREEMDRLGWEQADVILVSGDAYVDHPAFGTAVLARIAEHCGLRIAVLPQPNWRDDLRDFKKLGPPKYFFGVSAGAMDSMVNHYTARRRKRSEDAYTPGGRPGYRPDMASVVYTRILKQLYPDTPVLLGGVEASMRRLSHYDYWEDRVRPSVLLESGADMLVYGMAEMPFMRVIELLERGVPFSSLHNMLQTVFVNGKDDPLPPLKGRKETFLPSHEACLSDKRVFADTFRIIEEASNRTDPDRLIQPHGDKMVVVNPPFPLPDRPGTDLPWDLPFTRLPHPRYQKKPAIPAYEMIKHSVTLHRGCFGGCSFCAISAHQGKFISSRSERSVLQELEKIVQTPGFKGHITDLGGPTANMYRMGGVDSAVCRKCRRPSCIFPNICHNLNFDHNPLIRLYDKALAVPGVKKVTIGSGIRYDMLEGQSESVSKAYGLKEYTRKLLLRHVSGRLKVAPEHTETQVLRSMRKPPFSSFERFHLRFREVCRKEGLSWQLVPYFISGHPGCRERDMESLASTVKQTGLRPEPVQEFTPTPMTLSTTMYYTGIDPYSGKKVFSARSDEAKKRQKAYFFDPLRHRGKRKPG